MKTISIIDDLIDQPYIGYETEGGLRAYLAFDNNLWGFKYWQTTSEVTPPCSNSTVFCSPRKKHVLSKAMNSGRTLCHTKDLQEFTTWLNNSIATRTPIKHIKGLMKEHNISLRDLRGNEAEFKRVMYSNTLTRDEKVALLLKL